MNTIRIILKESGAFAELYKDFRLYKGCYQSKLINIYVPKSLIYQKASEFVNVVKIGAILTNEKGETINTGGFFLSYLKDETINNVEYEVYEGLLPKEFCVFAGTQKLVVNIVNIINLENPEVADIVTSQVANLEVLESADLSDAEVIPPSDLELINSKINEINKELLLKQSITDNMLTTTDKTIVGAINELENDKQNITDNALQTSVKTIVGAINELVNIKQNITDSALKTLAKTIVGAINENVDNLNNTNAQVATNTNNISKNTNDIEHLKNNVSTGEDLIGTLTTNEVPATPEELNAFVLANRNRQPKNGDKIYNEVILDNDTDQLYVCSYNGSVWGIVKVPSFEISKNGTKGILQGTYGIDSTNLVLVDIVAGEIVNIYIKVGEEYKSIVELINQNLIDIETLKTQVAGIIDGSIQAGNAKTLGGKAESELDVLNSAQLGGKVESQLSVNSATLLNGKQESQLNVASSVKATQDAQGNVINEFYAPISSVYTKQESDGRFLSKSFGALWYLAENGLMLEPPTTPETGVQFEKEFTTAGLEQLFFNIDHSVVGDLEFNSATAAEIVPKLAFSRTSNTIIKVNYFVKKQGETDFTQIGLAVSDELSINGNDSYPIVTIPNLKTNFSLIPIGEFIDLKPGDILRIQMLFTFDASNPINARLYSNEAYPSTFRLALDNTVVLESNSGAVPVLVNESAWTFNDTEECYVASIPQSQHHIDPTYNLFIQARYLSSAEIYEEIDLASSTDTNGNITLYSTTPLNLYVIIAGGMYRQEVN